MRRPDHTTPFDHERDDAPDLTTEFWGDGAAWTSRRRPGRRNDAPQSTDVRDATGTMHAIRDGVAAFRPKRVTLRDATGQMRRTRAHGVTVGDEIAARRAGASIGDLAAGHFDEPAADPFSDDPFFADPFEDDPRPRDRSRTDRLPSGRRAVEPREMVPLASPRRSAVGVDPLLARLGGMLLAGVLLVPVAISMRPADAAPDTIRLDAPTGAPAGAGAVEQQSGARLADAALEVAVEQPDGAATDDSPLTAAPDAAAASTSATDGAGDADDTTDTTDTMSDSDVGDDTGAQAVTESVEESTQSGGAAISEAATVDDAAERVVPECPQTYTAAAGDSWYGIAEAAGVSPDALMTENRATVDTVILPGDDICLPTGATMPAPPTTPPSTTPSTTAPTSTEPATTTTRPPSTTPPGSPGRNASVEEVKDVIRSVFPESEWETAFVIAGRESRFEPTAYNGWCCYGIFQIYWNVHRGWLDDLGIDSSDDLFDPLLNVRAAHAIWQRAGNSWSPWSTYDG